MKGRGREVEERELKKGEVMVHGLGPGGKERAPADETWVSFVTKNEPKCKSH